MKLSNITKISIVVGFLFTWALFCLPSYYLLEEDRDKISDTRFVVYIIGLALGLIIASVFCFTATCGLFMFF